MSSWKALMLEKFKTEGAVAAEMARRAKLVKNRATKGNSEWGRMAAQARWKKSSVIKHKHEEADSSKDQSVD